MADDRQVLAARQSLEELRVAEDALRSVLAREGAVHVEKLLQVMALYGQYAAEGRSLSGPPAIALLLCCSEWRAGRLLHEGTFLSGLPGAFDAIAAGVLTVEQSAVVVTELAAVTGPEVRLALWERLLTRLGKSDGAVLPPARLRELLRRWTVRAEPKDAEQRRREGEQERRVEYRRRDDGLVDLLLFGVAAPLAQAVLQRIREQSEPVGLFDDRLADQRRLDAAVDLLLGRTGTAGCAGSAACGCLPGTPVPCGTNVKVLVPQGAADGSTDEVAELVGHGPIEPDLLQALLANAPRLRPVFVDDHGVPVALGRPVPPPERGDPASLRRALLALVGSRSGRWHPRYPDDHPHAGPQDLRPQEPWGAEEGGSAPDAGSHPPDTPGGYAVTGLLRELIFLRAPLCEFPGCGALAECCDAEHDVAWPLGPTCACNLGPCCRRHHRCKQQGWLKTRQADSSVLWTSPTGRQWLSPSQHEPPRSAVPSTGTPATPAAVATGTPAAGVPAVTAHPLDELSPGWAEQELWELSGRPDDPAGLELRSADVDPDGSEHDDGDELGERITADATRWTLDLIDPYAWTDQPART